MTTKGKKTGTPNYKNDMLLNCIDIILPAGPEGWKTVASRYQIVSGEAGLRFYDDVRRHFFTKLCKNGKRQTGLNNKSANYSDCFSNSKPGWIKLKGTGLP